MATSSLALYKNHTQTETLTLSSVKDNIVTYKVAGRSLALPSLLTIERKIGSAGAKANDHIVVRRQEIQQSTVIPANLVTGSVTLDISIPRDSTFTAARMLELLLETVSLLEDAGATAATAVNATALIAGSDV